MLASILQQIPGQAGGIEYILGLVVSLVISAIYAWKQKAQVSTLKEDQQYSEAAFEKQRATATDFATSLVHLIVGNNDPGTDQKKYDQMVASATTTLVQKGQKAGIDVDSIINSVKSLHLSTSPPAIEPEAPAPRPAPTTATPAPVPPNATVDPLEAMFTSAELEAIKWAPDPEHIKLDLNSMPYNKIIATIKLWGRYHGFVPMTPAS